MVGSVPIKHFSLELQLGSSSMTEKYWVLHDPCSALPSSLPSWSRSTDKRRQDKVREGCRRERGEEQTKIKSEEEGSRNKGAAKEGDIVLHTGSMPISSSSEQALLPRSKHRSTVKRHNFNGDFVQASAFLYVHQR